VGFVGRSSSALGGDPRDLEDLPGAEVDLSALSFSKQFLELSCLFLNGVIDRIGHKRRQCTTIPLFMKFLELLDTSPRFLRLRKRFLVALFLFFLFTLLNGILGFFPSRSRLLFVFSSYLLLSIFLIYVTVWVVRDAWCFSPLLAIPVVMVFWNFLGA